MIQKVDECKQHRAFLKAAGRKRLLLADCSPRTAIRYRTHIGQSSDPAQPTGALEAPTPRRRPGTIYHWITSSAIRRSERGIVSLSAFAVFMLMTSSNLVGCSTGSSPGFAPLRILSTNAAARCHRPARLAA